MAKLTSQQRIFAMHIRGKLGSPPLSTSRFGHSLFGHSLFSDNPSSGNFPLPPGIYQMRKTKEGKLPILMKFYSPSNPQTANQQSWRSQFASAVSSWQSLTTQEKSYWNHLARGRSIYGYHLYIKQYLRGEL